MFDGLRQASRVSLRRLRSERGAELIEFAAVFPILLLVVGGMVDFGFVFRSWQVVTNAAREGARVGSLPGYQCAPGGDVEPRVNAYLDAAGMADAGASIEVSPTATGGMTSCSVVVTVDQPLPSLGVFGQFFGDDFTTVSVGSSATMRMEAQAP